MHSAFKSYWGPQQHLQIQIIRDQGRQQCWLEQVVYTPPLWGLITDVCVVAGTGHRHTQWWGPGIAGEARAKCRYVDSCRGSGCRCAPLWLQDLLTGAYSAVEEERNQARVCRCTSGRLVQWHRPGTGDKAKSGPGSSCGALAVSMYFYGFRTSPQAYTQQ